MEKKENEKSSQLAFPPRYKEIKVGEETLNELKAPNWMDAKVKIKEVYISNDDWPKMAQLRY